MIDNIILGAVCGDIAGSIYEWHNLKHENFKERPEVLIEDKCRFTDDTVMTCAVAVGLMNGLKQIPRCWIGINDYEEILFQEVQEALRFWGNKYIDAGYGRSFVKWLKSDTPTPYGSWGNGSAMRASFAGWFAESLEEAEKLGEISASVTHNHINGINGAKVISGCIYLLLQGKGKAEIEEYAKKFYDLNFSLDKIRASYTFDVSCQGSVPQAIKAFLEAENFSDAIATAISIGGDSDTIAAITGSIAEVYYPIDEQLKQKVIAKIPIDILEFLTLATEYVSERKSR